MSSGAARVFLPALREVERGLLVPIPEQVRILRELEFDLEELRKRLMADGLSPEEAGGRALEALVPDQIALRDLGRLHSPLYRRVTRHVSGENLRMLERSALVASTTAVLIVEAQVLIRADLLRDPSPFLWPVLGVGALLFAAIVDKAFELWIKRDHRTPEHGLGGILALAGATLTVGLSGVLFDFYRLAEVLEGTPQSALALGSQWLVRDAALLSISILLALAGGLAWFVLSQWLTLVSGARRDALGLGIEINSDEGVTS